MYVTLTPFRNMTRVWAPHLDHDVRDVITLMWAPHLDHDVRDVITLVWAPHLDHDVRDVITLGDEDVHRYELRRDI